MKAIHKHSIAAGKNGKNGKIIQHNILITQLQQQLQTQHVIVNNIQKGNPQLHALITEQQMHKQMHKQIHNNTIKQQQQIMHQIGNEIII